jgi:hypothetical protein
MHYRCGLSAGVMIISQTLERPGAGDLIDPGENPATREQQILSRLHMTGRAGLRPVT